MTSEAREARGISVAAGIALFVLGLIAEMLVEAVVTIVVGLLVAPFVLCLAVAAMFAWCRESFSRPASAPRCGD